MWISLLVLLSWLLVTPAWAAPPTKLLWDRNTEIDMLEYGVYSCSSSAVCVPNTKIGTVPQPAIGSIPEFALPVNTQSERTWDFNTSASHEPKPCFSRPNFRSSLQPESHRTGHSAACHKKKNATMKRRRPA